MLDIYMADISEFQGNIDAPAYLGAGCQVVICRVHNSARADRMMPARRDYLRGYPFVGIGWYQYLTAGADPARAANAFVGTVGELAANEWPILDLEEGSGDQTGRAAAWFGVVDRWAGFPAMLYSGDSFLHDHLGGSGRWAGRPIWVAAYGPDDGRPHTEPAQAHTLWQFSSRWPAPGVGACDGSVHHGTAAEFIASVRGGRPQQAAPTPPPAPAAPTRPPALEVPEVIIIRRSSDNAQAVFDGTSAVWIPDGPTLTALAAILPTAIVSAAFCDRIPNHATLPGAK